MLRVSFRKFSQLSNRSTIDKVTIYNAMSYFLDHPVPVRGINGGIKLIQLFTRVH